MVQMSRPPKSSEVVFISWRQKGQRWSSSAICSYRFVPVLRFHVLAVRLKACDANDIGRDQGRSAARVLQWAVVGRPPRAERARTSRASKDEPART